MPQKKNKFYYTKMSNIITDTILTNSITHEKDELIKKIMDLSYPIGSIWFSNKEYDVNNKTACKGTPLEYGTWAELNRDEQSNNQDVWGDMIFGLRRKGLNEKTYWGEYKLNVNNIPQHSHVGLLGYAYGYDKNNSHMVINGATGADRGQYVIKNDVCTGETIAYNVKWENNKFEKTMANGTKDDFHPRGCYAYGYEKTSL